MWDARLCLGSLRSDHRECPKKMPHCPPHPQGPPVDIPGALGGGHGDHLRLHIPKCLLHHNFAQSHCKSPGNCPEAAAAAAIAQALGTGAQKRWAGQLYGKEAGCYCWSHCDNHYLGHPRHCQDLQKLWNKHSQSKYPSFIQFSRILFCFQHREPKARALRTRAS